MKCPKCNVDMRRTDYGEVGFVILDICPQCEGTWFDEGELDQLDDSVSTNAELLDFEPAEENREDIQCPVCQEALETISRPGGKIVIDRCGSCKGFWLDKGELEHVRSELLKVDSEQNKDTPLMTRPPGWSWIRWTLYLYRQRLKADIEDRGSNYHDIYPRR